MARFTLSIETSDDQEFAAFAQRLAGLTPAEPVAVAADKPARPPRAKAKDAGIDEMEAARNGGDPDPVPAPAPAPAPVVETPAAPPPAVEVVNPLGGPITLDMLKDELGKLLRKEGFGAKAAQDLIREHGKGAAGLSQTAPEDYAAVYAALSAANAS